MNHAEPRTFNPVLMGASIGVGIGLAIVAKDMIDSLFISGVVAALVAGASTFAIYKLGLLIAAKRRVQRKPVT